MKECAVVKNGTDVIKVLNLKRKYNKIINNPNMTILEECDKDSIEEIYNKYITIPKEENDEDVKSKEAIWHVPNTNLWWSTFDFINPPAEGYVLSTSNEFKKWIYEH